MQAPALVLNTNAQEDKGKRAQFANIAAAKSVADIVRTTLGPRSMLKMILDPMGGIVLTNDGNAILREIDVNHPAAKSMIELSRTQDEEVGDGTTSVIILAGEMLTVAQPFLDRRMHPRTIVAGFNRALIDAEQFMKSMATDLAVDDEEEILSIVKASLGTKFVSRYGDYMCRLALKAVQTVREVDPAIQKAWSIAKSASASPSKKGPPPATAAAAVESDSKVSTDEAEQKRETGVLTLDDMSVEEVSKGVRIDTKRYVRIERIPGGQVEDSCVLDGVIINKDVLHPKMRRRIERPRVMCLDCPLEYNKGESQTNIEISKGTDFTEYLKIEEQYLRKVCDDIIALKPDVVITEKGCSELVQHFLWKANISVMRRAKKLYNLRIGRATGATIGHRVDLMKESDIGTKCGLFEIRQIAGEKFAFFVGCDDPKACSVLLRGGSKDIIQEMARNFEDALAVTRNVMKFPRKLPGGGATEMAVSSYLTSRAESIEGTAQFPYRAVARALEVIPRTLIFNCGEQPIRVLTSLRAKHANESDGDDRRNFGVDGITGKVVDVRDLNIWEPFVVKMQTIKTAIESASMLLRIDDVVSGLRNTED